MPKFTDNAARVLNTAISRRNLFSQSNSCRLKTKPKPYGLGFSFSTLSTTQKP